jgi:hypothetical protein
MSTGAAVGVHGGWIEVCEDLGEHRALIDILAARPFVAAVLVVCLSRRQQV